MATQISAIQISGKLGEVVGIKGYDGKNFARIKVTPANPKSDNQVKQRVKMSLAGLFSKLTPAELLIGMGSSKRKRRTRFTSNIARKAVITTANDETIAKLDPADLVFSEGIYAPAPTLNVVYDGSTATINSAAFPEGVSAVLVVGVFTDPENGIYRAVQGGVITDHEQPLVMNGVGGQVNIYEIPIVRAEGATTVTYERAIERIAADNSYSAVAAMAQAGALDYAQSSFVGAITPQG